MSKSLKFKKELSSWFEETWFSEISCGFSKLLSADKMDPWVPWTKGFKDIAMLVWRCIMYILYQV